MADKIKILDLDISTDSILAKSVQLKQDLDAARSSVLELKKAGDTSSETYNTLSAQVSKLSSEYNLNQKQLVSLITASGTLLTATEKANALMGVEAVTRKEAIEQNKELSKIRDEINAKTPEGVEAIKKLNEKMDQNTEFIKENSNQFEKQKINIGNYTDSINSSVIGTTIWGGKLNELKYIHEGLKSSISQGKELLKGYADGIRDYSKGTEGMTLAQKASTIATNVSTSSLGLFKVALASTGVGLLVLALAGLIGYFTQTQAGIDKLNGVLQPLKAVFTAVYSVVVSMGEALVNAFSNPKKAMSDLVSFVETNLINRFKAFGVILDGIMNLDFKKVTDGVLQAGTGVEGMTGKIAAAGQKTSDFLSDAAKKGKDIADRTKEINDLQLKYNANQIAFNDALDEQLLIAKDTSKTYAERAKASQEIIKLTEQNGKEEAKILELKLKQLQAEQSLKGQKNLTNEDKQKTIDLLNQIDEAEDRGKEARLEQMRVLSGLAKEEKKNREDATKANIEKQQKAIDLAILNSKTLLALFVAENSERAKTFKESLKLEEDIRDKRLAILKTELANKKISQSEFDLQDFQSKKEYFQKLSNLTLQFSKAELDLYIAGNKSKIENGELLTKSIIDEEAKRLESIKLDKINLIEQEKNTNDLIIEKKRLANIQLSLEDLEYLTAKANLESEFEAQIKENKKSLAEQEKQEKASQLQADKDIALANAQSELEQELLNNQAQFDLELIQLQEQKDKLLLTEDQFNKKKKIAQDKLDLADKKSRDLKLAQTIDLYVGLGNAAQDLFGKNKELSIALALADTYASATRAYYSQFMPIPTLDSPARGTIAAGTAILSGLANVAQITKLKLADGAIDIDGEGSETSDSIPAMLSRGESVINAKSTARFKPLLKAINEGNGYNYLANGANAYNGYTHLQNSGGGLDYDLLASKIGAHVTDGVKNIPAPNLSLEYFHQENNNYQNAVNLANH